jgi:trk system potassium uptake protein TrkH
MHSKIILKVLGLLLMVFSASLVPPVLIALFYQDGALLSFVKVLIGVLVLGLLLWYPVRNSKQELKIRDRSSSLSCSGRYWDLSGHCPLHRKEVPLSLTDAILSPSLV